MQLRQRLRKIIHKNDLRKTVYENRMQKMLSTACCECAASHPADYSRLKPLRVHIKQNMNGAASLAGRPAVGG